MWGFDGEKPRVFVENKFWAGLTDNQPVSYLKQLAKLEQPAALIFIVPAAREQTAWRELLIRLEKSEVGHSARAIPSGIVFSADTQLGPTISLTSWSKILSTIENGAAGDSRAMADVLQLRSLCEEADRDAFVPFSAVEISDQRSPARILDLGRVVQDAVQLAVTEKIIDLDGLKPQASWERIGRYLWFVGDASVGAWFGIHFVFWKQYGLTPLWLLFSPGKFGRAEVVRPVLESWAIENQFVVVTRNNDFLVSVPIVTGEDKDIVVHKVVNSLRMIGAALSVIPPSQTPPQASDE
jgi:hypothetical protein